MHHIFSGHNGTGAGSTAMVGTIHRLKNRLRSSRLLKKEDPSALEDNPLRHKQTQEEIVSFDRCAGLTDTVSVTDDVEEMFYARSTTSHIPQTRTTQIRGNIALSALNEDIETSSVSNVSSIFSQFSAATPTTSSEACHYNSNNYVLPSAQRLAASSPASSENFRLESLRSEVLEIKEEVKSFRREVLNELHLTRYDVLKELTLLKGVISQLCATQLPNLASPVSPTESSSSDTLSTEVRAILTRQTSAKTSDATRDRLAASRAVLKRSPSLAARASVRLTQLVPVEDNALSTPLDSHQINELFPLIDCTSDFAAHARCLTPGSRVWALNRVQQWLDARFHSGSDNFLAVVGEGGSGKSAFCGTVAQQFCGNILAAHCCQFDRKSESHPRNVLLSMVHQLVYNLPSFKSHLARLNLKYVLNEKDSVLLALKVLVDPLNAIEEPVQSTFILIDGIDQCSAGTARRNELMEFFTQIIPQLPPWLGLLVSSKPSIEFAKRVPVSSVLDFSANNTAYMADVSSLVNEIAQICCDVDVLEAEEILKAKSGGNFTYLEFTKQALTHPGMAMTSQKGLVPLSVLEELPETLYDIYAEIFEDKFGQVRTHIWTKAKQLLQLIVGAAAGPYSLVSEEQAKEQLNFTTEDLKMLRRSMVDLVTIKHGCYRMESSALCDWLSDSCRSEEQFYVSIEDALFALRKMRRVNSGGSIIVHSSFSSDHCSSYHASTLTRAGSREESSRKSRRFKPRENIDFKPVGILKHGRL
ncbi:uncharacterized protein CCR75_005092 [Bremia lactucae]|uniref:Nephrocystin 3-like N-terminal domain-containing protein n=1 Tax=Bremia lactucae TaxID=4779 RepID=A0A976FEW5_BRELC|nr:hypothetical protein CCR75_004062 [Bremia lactucae]TDH70625.1 hypothetical protein CCR75_005092 [Bremia lactucae]